jgi:hypothetical protein
LFFFMGQPKWMHTTFLLLSPASILPETNSNLRILWKFGIQTNLDFISNSNFNQFELLPHPYISSVRTPHASPTPIPPQT